MRSTTTALVAVILLVSSSASAAEPKKPPPSKADRAVKAVKKEAEQARNYVQEALVNTQVKALLVKNLAGADGMRISVEVNGAVVTLTGTVNERASMKLADEVARSVEGVKTVSNKIALNAGAAQQDGLEARIKDTLLEGEVRVRMLREAGESALKVELEAADGVVSVRGTVPDAARKEVLLKTVRGTPGVREVIDLLKTPG